MSPKRKEYEYCGRDYKNDRLKYKPKTHLSKKDKMKKRTTKISKTDKDRHLSALQKDDYIYGGALYCPYCGGYNIEAGPLNMPDCGDVYECRTKCLDCEKEWYDVYGVVQIIELE